MRGRYFTLQAGRAAAASLVVLFHATGIIAEPKYFGVKPLAGFFGFGYAGVEFFFVLSGFIIVAAHWQDMGRPQALGRYLARRAIRIFPAYWIVFLALGAAMLFMGTQQRYDTPTLVAALLLLPLDKVAVGGTGSPVVAVAWSLQYELVFYALFALLIINRKIGAAIAAIFLIVAAACWNAGTYPASFVGKSYVFLFALGSAVAALREWGAASRIRRFPRCLAAAGLVLFCCTAAFDVMQWIDAPLQLASLSYGLASALMIFGMVNAEDNGKLRWMKWPPLQLLGDASYAIYLTHFPVLSVVCKLLNHVPAIGSNWAFALAVGACLVVGVVFHRWVEKPVVDRLAARGAWQR